MNVGARANGIAALIIIIIIIIIINIIIIIIAIIKDKIYICHHSIALAVRGAHHRLHAHIIFPRKIATAAGGIIAEIEYYQTQFRFNSLFSWS